MPRMKITGDRRGFETKTKLFKSRSAFFVLEAGIETTTAEDG